MKAVILAAGESSRFRPLSDNRHKALISALGKPLVEHTVEELRAAGVEEIVVVQGPDRSIESEIGDSVDHYVVQEEPEGMGHALEQAREHLDDRFLVLTPYRARASQFFQPMIEKAEEEDAETVFVSTPTSTPEKYGILELDEDGKAVDLVEKPDPEDAPGDQKVVGMYLLSMNFFDYLDDVEEWEYQFEDALSDQMKDRPASVLKIDQETNSIKYPWDLFSVVEELMDGKEQHISDKADIAGSAIIDGPVTVRKGAKIYENAVVRGPAYIGEDVTVGNNAVIRDHSVLESGVTVGANSEVARSVFQPDSSMHSGYVGDSIIGRNSSLGAGTITANRNFREDGERPEIDSKLIAKDRREPTGRTSMGAIIGENVDIGVNCSIMPGVQIGSDSRIGPGTNVMKNVGEEKTFYARQDTVEK
ncbi:MAG: bifunctional sugar-1-phosphate nucleotidylyltransferase/acetyltransferase [Candidatus Nanohaloarchaea archaeon]